MKLCPKYLLDYLLRHALSSINGGSIAMASMPSSPTANASTTSSSVDSLLENVDGAVADDALSTTSALSLESIQTLYQVFRIKFIPSTKP